MKKTLSTILAIVMALSVFSGISFSAFAADVQQVEVCLSKPITVIENVDGFWAEHGREEYFLYDYYFSIEDTVKVIMSDGTEIEYFISVDDEDFVDESGNVLEWYVYDNQEEEHWGIGTHKAYFVVCDNRGIPLAEGEFPVQVISSPIESVSTSFTAKKISENTNGYWGIDEDDNNYFHYVPDYLFEEGDTITLNMKDGSSVAYTFKELYFEEEDWSYYAFINDDGEELAVVFELDTQYDEHWGLGTHEIRPSLPDYGIDFAFSVEIIKGSQDTCWHYEEWKFVNGIFQSECIGCGMVTKMPFTDLKGYDYYADFLAYTSVYNEFLRGTNPPEFTIFSPQTTITRAMLVTILYRMAGEPYSDGGNPYSSTPFTDIADKNAYYYDAACWALENGITTETTFKPFDNVTREQTASFLFRYAQNNDMLGDDGYKEVNLKSEYLDASLIHPWAAEAMQWANYNDMITGTMQRFANPQGATQRIHATKILFGFGYLCGIGIYY